MRVVLRIAFALAVLLFTGAPGISAAQPQRIRWVRSLTHDPAGIPVAPVQRATPTIADGVVYAGIRDGQIWALDATDGRTLWRKTLGGAIEADPIVDRGSVYAATITGGVMRLDRRSGNRMWYYFAGYEVQGRMALAEGRLVFATTNNQVVALRATDGTWQWQYAGGDDPDMSVRGISGVIVAEGRVYAGQSNGVLVSLEAATGKSVWVTPAGEASVRFVDVDSRPLLTDEHVCAVVFGHALRCLRRSDGSIVWSVRVSAQQAPALVAGTFYLPGLDGWLRSFDARTGQPVWQTRISPSGAPLNTPVEILGRLVVTDTDGIVVVVNPEAGRIEWEYRGAVSGTYAPTGVADRDFFVLTNLGNLFRFSPVRWGGRP